MNKYLIIKKLNKQFVKLTQGKTVNVKISPKPITIPVKMYWESETTGCHSYDSEQISNYFDTETDRLLKPVFKSFNKQISDFINKCDSIADQLDEDRECFFKEILNFNRPKK